MPLLSLVLAFQLQSTTFAPDTTIPKRAIAKDCGGQNVSPELHWDHAPKGAKSFALVVHDPDAPIPGGFYHWVIPSIPASLHELAEGRARFAGYYGPCPPPGKVHHYHFTLYALDTVLENGAALDAPHLLERIKGHVIAQTTLIGLYAVTSSR
ncbi:MAG TPA: YbhB/YbcL family Raf kinase inhibitor-like protein [Candidatus Aquilonibacter sp.]|nr:YbhB/YbcL family Raf kinase inhibitor-like protein [Candidatus Aquilonibacter sp.]